MYIKNMKNSYGYTIIELLVAVAILSIVFTALVTILMHQQRQFNLTSQGVDVDQTGRIALDFIATEIRNSGARQGKTVAFDFVNGGSGSTPFCDANTTDVGQDAPPDCLTLYTWDITAGFKNDEIQSTVLSGKGTLVGSNIVVNVDGWFPHVSDPAVIESGDLIGFWSRGSLCNPADLNICLTTPEQCTECGVILKMNSLNTSTRRATISGVNSILSQNFQIADFTDFSVFANNFFIPRIAGVPSEMSIVKSRTFAIRNDNALVMSENGSPTFQAIAGGELDDDTTVGDDVQVGAGIVDLQFVFNLQDADGGITRVGMQPFDDDEAIRQFADFTSISSDTSLSYNGDMRGRQMDTRTVEIYLVVRSRLKPQLISGNRIPSQTIEALGDVESRPTSHSSLGEGFIYKVFNTVVYLRNLGREEFG